MELEAENWRLELEDENWRLCSATLVRGVSGSWKMRTGDFLAQL